MYQPPVFTPVALFFAHPGNDPDQQGHYRYYDQDTRPYTRFKDTSDHFTGGQANQQIGT